MTSDVKPLACDLCDYRTSSRGFFDRHLRTSHGDATSAPPSEHFACDSCEFAAGARSTLIKHVRTAHSRLSELMESCEYCPFKTDHR